MPTPCRQFPLPSHRTLESWNIYDCASQNLFGFRTTVFVAKRLFRIIDTNLLISRSPLYHRLTWKGTNRSPSLSTKMTPTSFFMDLMEEIRNRHEGTPSKVGFTYGGLSFPHRCQPAKPLLKEIKPFFALARKFFLWYLTLPILMDSSLPLSAVWLSHGFIYPQESTVW